VVIVPDPATVHALREAQHSGTLSASSLLETTGAVSSAFFLVSDTSAPVPSPSLFLAFVFPDLLFASFWLESCHLSRSTFHMPVDGGVICQANKHNSLWQITKGLYS